MDELEFEWTITKFSFHLRRAELGKNLITLRSSSFTIGSSIKNTKWHLKMYLFGNEHNKKKFIGTYAVCENSYDGVGEIWASQKYFLINVKKERIELGNGQIDNYSQIKSWGYDEFYEKKKLLSEADKYLPNDELTVICQIQVMGDIITSVDNSLIPKLTMNNLSYHLSKILQSEEFSDVTFLVCNKKIQAHKSIMAARSPVFATMFRHRMDEQEDNRMTIDDIDADVFKEMLRYIYTCEVPHLDDMAMDLLPVAVKYGLEDLKNMCQESLCRNITVDNAAVILILAHQNNVEELSKFTQDFINMNIVDVMETEGYINMEKKQSELIAMLYRNSMMKLAICDQTESTSTTSTCSDEED